jgi:hypothetical protein
MAKRVDKNKRAIEGNGDRRPLSGAEVAANPG